MNIIVKNAEYHEDLGGYKAYIKGTKQYSFIDKKVTTDLNDIVITLFNSIVSQKVNKSTIDKDDNFPIPIYQLMSERQEKQLKSRIRKVFKEL